MSIGHLAAGAVMDAWQTSWGFLTPEAVSMLAADPGSRLSLLLVRFSQGRCLAPAQDVAALIAACERGGWCVRDVSIPVDGDLARFAVVLTGAAAPSHA